MMTRERNYVTANELAETLGVSTGQAYKIIRRLNNELDKKGFITVSGKCPRRYLEEKWYGYGKKKEKI